MKIRLVISLIVLTAIACSPVRIVDTEEDPGFKLSRYQTFDFLSLEGTGDTTENFDNNAGLIKAAIDRELRSRGLKPSADQPDLLVNVGIVVENKVQTRETTLRDAPRYIGQRRYSWKSEEVEVGRYKEGTVTIDLVDRVSNKLVWKGVAEGTVSDRPERLESAIDKGVGELFSKL